MFTFYESKFVSPWKRVSWSKRIYRRRVNTLRQKLSWARSKHRGDTRRKPAFLIKDLIAYERSRSYAKYPTRINYCAAYRK